MEDDGTPRQHRDQERHLDLHEEDLGHAGADEALSRLKAASKGLDQDLEELRSEQEAHHE